MSFELDALLRTRPQPPETIAWAWALERNAAEPLEHRVLPSIADVPSRPPTRGELWLWFGEPATASFAEFLAHLDSAEQARALGFRVEADRWTCAASRACLRALLGAMLGAAPLGLSFLSGPKGKPLLSSGRIHFNVSHTRGLIAIAIAGSPVGVDVEPMRHLPDLMDLSRLAFAPQMQAELSACPNETLRTRMFFRFWTLAEAYIKATGEGVSQGLSSFVFDAEAARLIQAAPAWGPASRWRFHAGP
ncbi:4'-phosphopantetheinyl transferase family protein [Methylocystis heyeri]|uniref:4'-phosphopantetheinyl transferase superfamily protein n=1 Tax=Methylocystis heyeri TaxID=391905 RepID=A0A6B8KGF1_9HYPH|nr:4'-phosphopantetheinyl transferase superfamily protein [Methylocystis heyeri]QGM46699.1 4'-phosphopantetheinyl transferase superfamily protein [Methylocystis heyeri]